MPSATYGEQFESAEQERATFTVGMWTFICSEVMIFGALITSYLMMRVVWPADFAHAAKFMDIGIGTINTAVLLTSSLFMALAVRAERLQETRATIGWLLLTALFGAVFVALKIYEYVDHIHHHLLPGPHFALAGHGAQVFFWLYFLMTGVHALHLTLGVLMVLACSWWVRRHRADIPLDMLGLYWHFVDIVWVFLYPLFYLIGNH